MLKKQMEQYITNALAQDAEKIELHKEELDYVKRHELISNKIEVIEKSADARFSDAYLERCEKETVGLIVVETPAFLNEKIAHLKKQMGEFIYLESALFDIVGVDAISLEVDDVFGTYTAMFGLKLQKKYGPVIKTYLETNLSGEEGKYSIAFSDKDGLWDMNFALNYATGFKEDMTLLEAYNLTYTFILTMLEEIEAAA